MRFSAIFANEVVPRAVARSFSRVRVSVEWLFGEVVSLFPYLDRRSAQKIGLTIPGTMYLAASILALCRTALYRDKISAYFDLKPPSFEEIFF